MFYQCYNKTDYVYINFFITIRLNHIFLSLHELSLLKNNIHLNNVLLRLIRNKNINFRKCESIQLRYFGSCIGESNFDIRSFEFLNSLDYGNLNPKKTELSKQIISCLDFDLPCRTSPRRSSRGFPGGWI